jgi:hypothetical protein
MSELQEDLIEDVDWFTAFPFVDQHASGGVDYSCPLPLAEVRQLGANNVTNMRRRQMSIVFRPCPSGSNKQ